MIKHTAKFRIFPSGLIVVFMIRIIIQNFFRNKKQMSILYIINFPGYWFLFTLFIILNNFSEKYCITNFCGFQGIRFFADMSSICVNVPVNGKAFENEHSNKRYHIYIFKSLDYVPYPITFLSCLKCCLIFESRLLK